MYRFPRDLLFGAILMKVGRNIGHLHSYSNLTWNSCPFPVEYFTALIAKGQASSKQLNFYTSHKRKCIDSHFQSNAQFTRAFVRREKTELFSFSFLHLCPCLITPGLCCVDVEIGSLIESSRSESKNSSSMHHLKEDFIEIRAWWLNCSAVATMVNDEWGVYWLMAGQRCEDIAECGGYADSAGAWGDFLLDVI